jgi:EmrB/QacA subfamily drug resistance transporter
MASRIGSPSSSPAGFTPGPAGPTAGPAGPTPGPAGASGQGAPPQRLDPALIRLAAILLAGAIAAILDTTIVNVALDSIGRDLHASISAIQWVMTGYLLSYGMVIPLNGWALARFGARATWMWSLALFLAGSVASGAAWSIGSLITFRVIQGIGGGMLLPVMTTLLVQAAGGRSVGRLMATVSLPAVVVPVAGPVAGGLITGSLSWRWIFYVNVPICLTGLVLAWRGLPAGQRAMAGPKPRLDLAGLALLSPGLAAILYGLAQVSTDGGFGHVRVIAPVTAGGLALAVFALRGLRAGGQSEPVIDLRLFRIRTFTGAASLMFVSGLSMYGALLLLPLYYQQVRGASVLQAGLLLVPQGAGTLIPRTVAGRLTDRIGARPVVLAGMALAALGTLPFALAGPHTSEILLGAALVVRGAGLGMATIAVMAGAFTGLRRDQVPHASSATRIMQQVGGSFGAAVLTVILELQVTARPPGAARAAGLATAFGHTFWWALAFTAIGAGPAMLLSGRRRPGTATAVPRDGRGVLGDSRRAVPVPPADLSAGPGLPGSHGRIAEHRDRP